MVRYRRVATKSWLRHIDTYADVGYEVTPKLRLTRNWIHHVTTKTQQ